MKIVFPKQLITRSESYDFHRDGDYFKGYMYKNTIPITYLRADNYVFCSIRLDYLMHDYYAYQPVAHEMQELTPAMQEFNGADVNYFNMDKFIANCEKVLQFWNEHNTPEAKKAKIETEIAQLSQKINELEAQKAKLEQLL